MVSFGSLKCIFVTRQMLENDFAAHVIVVPADSVCMSVFMCACVLLSLRNRAKNGTQRKIYFNAWFPFFGTRERSEDVASLEGVCH